MKKTHRRETRCYLKTRAHLWYLTSLLFARIALVTVSNSINRAPQFLNTVLVVEKTVGTEIFLLCLIFPMASDSSGSLKADGDRVGEVSLRLTVPGSVGQL